MIVLRVADFTDAPGGEFIHMGPHSGEWFWNVALKPVVEETVKTAGVIQLHLDGVIGYPHTWLRGAFSPIGQIENEEDWCLVSLGMEVISEDHPEVESAIRDYMWKELPGIQVKMKPE